MGLLAGLAIGAHLGQLLLRLVLHQHSGVFKTLLHRRACHLLGVALESQLVPFALDSLTAQAISHDRLLFLAHRLITHDGLGVALRKRLLCVGIHPSSDGIPPICARPFLVRKLSLILLACHVGLGLHFKKQLTAPRHDG